MLVGLCLTLVDVAQRDDELTDLVCGCVLQTLRQWVRAARGRARGRGPFRGGRRGGRDGRGGRFGPARGAPQGDA